MGEVKRAARERAREDGNEGFKAKPSSLHQEPSPPRCELPTSPSRTHLRAPERHSNHDLPGRALQRRTKALLSPTPTPEPLQASRYTVSRYRFNPLWTVNKTLAYRLSL
ncbi:hypothetical protein VZT92_017330 [Zoarces viviparus]|uniref:Uncharacterized protein n=1 Tax=Zoarces viviparus TaxID=48416 RepID=A0AAW1EQK1_ZOAVI